jgi:hypothetical protein
MAGKPNPGFSVEKKLLIFGKTGILFALRDTITTLAPLKGIFIDFTYFCLNFFAKIDKQLSWTPNTSEAHGNCSFSQIG